MDQCQSLLERFLRNKSTGREKKTVAYALRDGLIDDEFRQAIDAVMNDADAIENMDRMPPVPEDILKNIRSRMTTPEPVKHRRTVPEWLKIAATVAVTLSVSWLVFRAETGNETPLPAMHTITVPAGQNVNITLSDGTNIWLNSRSVLQYPGVFAGARREVHLDGEGFFEVTHDREHPFVVHAGGYDVQALGTQFNVESWSQNDEFTASLLSGAVKVSSATDTSQYLVLHPNTMARLHNGRLMADTITDFSYYRWREGLISFKEMPFPRLMEKFEKCYGIKIIVKNNRIKDYALTGKFRQSDGIDYALRVLQRDFPFRFERDEEQQVIYIK